MKGRSAAPVTFFHLAAGDDMVIQLVCGTARQVIVWCDANWSAVIIKTTDELQWCTEKCTGLVPRPEHFWRQNCNFTILDILLWTEGDHSVEESGHATNSKWRSEPSVVHVQEAIRGVSSSSPTKEGGKRACRGKRARLESGDNRRGGKLSWH